MDEHSQLHSPEFLALLEHSRSLRELAQSWYALSLACRRTGATIEQAAKEMLYERANNSDTSEINNENNTTAGDALLPS